MFNDITLTLELMVEQNSTILKSLIGDRLFKISDLFK